jgi:hypothetical protein
LFLFSGLYKTDLITAAPEKGGHYTFTDVLCISHRRGGFGHKKAADSEESAARR